VETLIGLILAPALAILWHEASHALFALAVSRGRVTLTVGFGPSVGVSLGRFELRFAPVLLGGHCAHEDTGRRGDRALIAAVGPISSVFLAALAWNLRQGTAPGLAAELTGALAVCGAFMAVITAVPMRYDAVHESDGMTVLRAFFPVAATSPRWPQPESRPDRPLRLPFVIVLALVTPFAFMASIWTGLFVVALFSFAFAGERR
jgi:hypothetical protein